MSLRPEKFWDRNRLISRLKNNSKNVDGHWLWMGEISSTGYGRIQLGGRANRKNMLVHRLSAFLFLRLDLNKDNSYALHKSSCPYKNCWEPNCIYIGTQQDNMEDRKGKENYEQCGHKKEGYRRCRICHNAWTRAAYHKRKQSSTNS